MTTERMNGVALDFGTADPETFKVCSFLVNVMSHMYAQWESAGFPLSFDWSPAYVCKVSSDFKVEEFVFGSLIWSTFTYKKKGVETQVTEPFGALVESRTNGNQYLVFRGSKSDADLAVDAEIAPVAYTAPTPHCAADIQVEKGWYAVYNGMRDALRIQLLQISKRNLLLTVTGHSLGSALATLAVPDAVACGLQVRHYNSASPMVGHLDFREYYEGLRVTEPCAAGWLETFRLVNISDVVPNFPGISLGYLHVGRQVSFNANYGAELKNHDPCCCYAYAIYNPENPFNPDADTCAANDKK